MRERDADYKKSSEAAKRGSKLNIIRASLLAVAALMIVFGLTHGEAAVVLQKAVKVCLECIGLG